MMDKPIEHCYWVVPGKLLAGEYPGHRERNSLITRINAFIKVGVGAFIDLTEERDGLAAYRDYIGPVVYQRFPIRDVSIPSSPMLTTEILDASDDHMDRGRMVYVHCWGGIGRTGTIIGCWLARHGYPGEPALRRLQDLWLTCPKSVWRSSPETIEQEQYIRNWEE